MKKALFYSLIFTLVISFISPLSIIDANKDDFIIDKGFSFLTNLLVVSSLIWGLSFMLFWLLFKIWRGMDRIVFVFIVILSVWAIYLPLSIGKLDGVDEITISQTNLMLGILAALVSFFLHKRSIIILSLLLIGPLLLACISLFNNVSFIKSGQVNSVLNVASDKKNIFVISFDALQPNYVTQVIESDDLIKESFRGFINYENAVAVAPYTRLSTVITKLGGVPDVESTRDLYLKRKDFITTILMNEEDYDVETYSYFNRGESEQTNTIPQYQIKNLKNDQYYPKALEASLFRIYPYRDLVMIKLHRFIQKIFALNEKYELIGKDPHPLAYYKQDIDDLTAYIESLEVGNTKPTFRMHHYVFTHDPITFTEDCSYRISNTVAQLDSIIEETTCAVRKMVDFIEKLKKLNVLDNSMIIFASDHGYGCLYNKRGTVGSYRVNKRWCLSRYQPILMVKNFDSNDQISNVKDEVSLLDIARTVCVTAVKDSSRCSPFEGYDLTSSVSDLSEYRRPILVGKGDDDVRNYSYFNKVDIGREGGIEEFFGLKENSIRYDAKYLPTRLKQKDPEKRMADDKNKPGFLTFGPYVDLDEGTHFLKITYKYSRSENNSETFSYWDVYSHPLRKTIYKNEFSETGNSVSTEVFKLVSDKPVPKIEVRSYFAGDGELEVLNIEFEK